MSPAVEVFNQLSLYAKRIKVVIHHIFGIDSFLMQPWNLKLESPAAIALLYDLIVLIIPASPKNTLK